MAEQRQHADSDVWCIVVAAGSGSRFGAQKQFQALGSRRVVDHALDVASQCCGGVVLVVPVGHSESAALDGVTVVTGGATRSESVRCGLAAVPDDATIVLVHDGARPVATSSLFDRVIAAVRSGADAAVPVMPIVDTVRDTHGGVVDRERLRSVQTPQGFSAGRLREAHRSAGEATDDAALVERQGASVVLVDGERTNLKVTEPSDLRVAAALLGEEHR